MRSRHSVSLKRFICKSEWASFSQVILVVEEALRRMKVTDIERKITLETLHYCQVQQQHKALENGVAERQQEAEAKAEEPSEEARPLTQ